MKAATALPLQPDLEPSAALEPNRSSNQPESRPQPIPASPQSTPEPASSTTGAAHHTLADGAQVLLTDSAVEVRNTKGMLLVRYESGSAHIAAPSGDLVLSAPHGDVRVQAQEALQIDSPQLRLRTGHAEIAADHAQLTAGRIATTAASHSLRAELLEVTALKLVERTRDTFREATDLLQTRAGRLRALVDRSYSLFSGRTTMRSKDETSIDGSKILLG